MLQGRISAASPSSQMMGRQTNQRHAAAGRLASPCDHQALCPVSGSRQQLVPQRLVGERHNRKMMPLLNEFPLSQDHER